MKAQRGLSLIELMVAMALGLMLVTSLLVVYSNAFSASKTNERATDLQANGRIAISTLKAELRTAGFKGFAWAPPNPPSTPLPPIGNECLQANAAAGSFASNIGQTIWGSQDANPFAANCIPRSHYARGDVLVIRRLSPLASSNRTAGPLYVRSSYAASEMFGMPSAVPCPAPMSAYPAPFNTAPCLAGTPGMDLQDFQMDIHVYFIRSYTVSPSESPLTPALCRLHLRNDGVMAEELVASGIEDLHVQYARTWTDGSTQYLEANALQDWNEVKAVRLQLLARSSTAEPGYANDGYRRQMLSTVVQLRNSHQDPDAP